MADNQNQIENPLAGGILPKEPLDPAQNGATMSVIEQLKSAYSEIPDTDLSLQFLALLFGPAIENLPNAPQIEGAKNIVSTLFLYFNAAMFIGITLIVIYMGFSSIINTARHGEFLGNERAVGNKAGYVLKPTFAALFTLPIAKIGYLSILQFSMLMLMVYSIGFANALYGKILDFFNENQSLQVVYEMKPDKNILMGIVSSQLCKRAYDKYGDEEVLYTAKQMTESKTVINAGENAMKAKITADAYIWDFKNRMSIYERHLGNGAFGALKKELSASKCGALIIACKIPQEDQVKSTTTDNNEYEYGAQRLGRVLRNAERHCNAMKAAYETAISHSFANESIPNIFLDEDITLKKSDVTNLTNGAHNYWSDVYTRYREVIESNTETVLGVKNNPFEKMRKYGWLMAGAWYGVMSRDTYASFDDPKMDFLEVHYYGPNLYPDQERESFEVMNKLYATAANLKLFKPDTEKIIIKGKDGQGDKVIEVANLDVEESASTLVNSLKGMKKIDGVQEILEGFTSNLFSGSLKTGTFILTAYPSDPIRSLAMWGHWAANTGLSIFAVGAIISTMSGAAYEGLKNEADAGDSIPILGSVLKATVGLFASVLAGLIDKAGEILYSLLTAVAVVMITVGAMMAYYLPMIPLIYWLFGALGWMMMIIESMIAAPIWGLAHAVPDKENGWFGAHNIQGYQLTTNVILRPILLVIGLISTIFLFYSIAKLTILSFNIAMPVTIGDGNNFGFAPVAWITGSIILVSTIITMTIRSQEAIYGIADAVMRWIGFGVSPLGEVKGGADAVRAQQDKAGSYVSGTLDKTSQRLQRRHMAMASKAPAAPDSSMNTDIGKKK